MTIPNPADPVTNDFPATVDAALGHLRSSTFLPNWAVTRNGPEGPVVLRSSAGGAVVRGRPRVDRRAHVEVISAPIPDPVTGTTFGSLVGYVTEHDVSDAGKVDAVFSAVRERASVHRPLVEALASLLSSVVGIERRAAAARRGPSRAEVTGRDPVTGLFDRRSWVQLMAEESDTLCRMGDPAAVVLLDVVAMPRVLAERGVEASDGMARAVAQELVAATSPHDVVSRLRTQEFGVLLIGPDAGARSLRLQTALSGMSFRVACGLAEHTNASVSLSDTMARADAALSARSVFAERRYGLGEGLAPNRTTARQRV